MKGLFECMVVGERTYTVQGQPRIGTDVVCGRDVLECPGAAGMAPGTRVAVYGELVVMKDSGNKFFGRDVQVLPLNGVGVEQCFVQLQKVAAAK